MTVPSYLQFAGLNGSIALEDAEALTPIVSDVFLKWPHTYEPAPTSTPFVSIKPVDENKWSLVLKESPEAPRLWDEVNVICDLAAEMAWERIRSDPTMLCLHAAAVEFAGRLVVFPNARRAGKSTLVSLLGRLGHRLFTDDVLPIRIDEESKVFLGIANGIAPRIRLPLPEVFSDETRHWVDQDPGPSNAQYKYLLNCPIADGGETMPLGAIVILDRKETPCPPSVSEVPIEESLTTLITQNFARTLHAGSILSSINILAKCLPIFRLTYHISEDAAAFLTAQDAFQELPAARHDVSSAHDRQAPLEQLGQAAPEFEPSRKYIQVQGVTETHAGEDSFLADETGLAIHRLNAGSAAIWRLFEEPLTLDEVVDLLASAFHDVDVAKISYDTENLMRTLAAVKLIVPARSDGKAE